MSGSQMRGTEYFPLPVAVSGTPAIVVASPKERKSGNNSGPGSPFGSSIGFGGRSAVAASSPIAAPPAPPSVQLPQFQAPYLQSVRVSKEVVIYKPPPFLSTRLSKMPPVISVQTELNATNFHEVAKSAVVDPVTQLNIPTWELRNPAPEELHAEKEFEAQEAQWEDEYWKEVAKFRQRLEINSKASEKGSTSPLSTARRSEKSFQRGDSFRIDARVPTSPIGPTQAPVLRRSSMGRKPPLPQAARASTTKKEPSSTSKEPSTQQKSSGSNQGASTTTSNQQTAAASLKEDSAVTHRNSSGPANVTPIHLPPASPNPTTPPNEEPLTAPSTPIHMDLLHRQATASQSTPEHQPLEPGRTAASGVISSIFVRPPQSGEDSPQPKPPAAERERERERETESMTPPPLPRGGFKMESTLGGAGGGGGQMTGGGEERIPTQGLTSSDMGLGSSLDTFGSGVFPVTKFRFHVRPSLESMSWNIVLPHLNLKAEALPPLPAQPQPQVPPRSIPPPAKGGASDCKSVGGQSGATATSSVSPPMGGKTTSPSSTPLAVESAPVQQGSTAQAQSSKGPTQTNQEPSNSKVSNQEGAGKENIKPSTTTTTEPPVKGESKPGDGSAAGPASNVSATKQQPTPPAPTSQQQGGVGISSENGNSQGAKGSAPIPTSQSTEPIPTEPAPAPANEKGNPQGAPVVLHNGEGPAKERRTEPIDTDPESDENPKPSRGCCSMM